ncbi:hypothetical protein EDD17DRAFT_1771376 [Pisolithus thermaeus]|nr:hypothetical protein EV401DRAFT_2068397 [Pisolithus croceorrhizus]KAI6137626.1 hypothetical protein EDD17DRAFT_1771376 [Pisolithus thermaeus]
MPKQQVSRKQLKFVQFLELLEADSEFLGAFETAPNSDTAWGCIKAAALKAQLPHPPQKLGDFLRIVSQHAANVPSQKLLLAVNNHRHASKVIANSNRQKKRELTNALGLGKGALPYSDLVTKNNLIIIQRDRIPDLYKCGTTLIDHGNEDLARDSEKVLFVPADDTWYVVGEHESIAFINSTGKSTLYLGCYSPSLYLTSCGIELVIIRGCCALCPDLIDHVNEVIDGVIHNRRGVRPTHGGKLIQYGWNAGPRHARVFGLVRNVANKKLNGEELAAQDKSILGIMSLTWNLLIAALPKEVIDPVKEKLAEASLPPMASPGNVKEHGYELSLPDGTLSWSTAERAPAEAYMSQNYTSPIHTDQLYAPYALNWVTMHEVIDHDAAGLHVRTKGSKFHRTSGGNYVDVSLGVVVRCAKDTVMAVKPTSRHGTTLSRPGVKCQGTAINFSTHIKTAFDKAMSAGGLVIDGGSNSE